MVFRILGTIVLGIPALIILTIGVLMLISFVLERRPLVEILIALLLEVFKVAPFVAIILIIWLI